jgi:hypothetical protein
VANSKGWTFNGISPALGAYKIVSNNVTYGVTGTIAEMGNPPENYAYTGVADLDIHKDTQTFAGVSEKFEGYNITQVGVSQGLTGIQGSAFTNTKHGF